MIMRSRAHDDTALCKSEGDLRHYCSRVRQFYEPPSDWKCYPQSLVGFCTQFPTIGNDPVKLFHNLMNHFIFSVNSSVIVYADY